MRVPNYCSLSRAIGPYLCVAGPSSFFLILYPCEALLLLILTRSMEAQEGPSSSLNRNRIEGANPNPPKEGDDLSMLNLSLVEKFISDKPFNKDDIRVAICRSWHFIKDFVMEETEGDRYIFTFPSVTCRQLILDQSTWNVKGFPLVPKSWEQGDTVFEVDFSPTFTLLFTNFSLFFYSEHRILISL